MRRHFLDWPGWKTAILVSLPLLNGCGGDGLDRHAISGVVNYAGRPLEMGSVAFEPDISAGKMAPSSYASVTDGKFTIAQADGPVTGKYSLRVISYDKSKIKLDVPPGTPINMPALVPPYMTVVEIPAPDGRIVVELPAGKPGK